MLNDRHWHELQVNINRNQLEVVVDRRNPLVLGLGAGPVERLSLTEPLYIGGLPAPSGGAQRPGVRSAEHIAEHNSNGGSLLGCIRDLHINKREENLQLPLANASIGAGCNWLFPCLSSPCSAQQVCVENMKSFSCECPQFMSDCGDNDTGSGVMPSPLTTKPDPPITSPTVLPRPKFIIMKTVITAIEGQRTRLSNATLVIVPQSPFSWDVAKARMFGPGIRPDGTPIIVFVTRPPTHGVLMSLELPLVIHFEMHQLALGQLFYVHDGSEETADSFAVSVVTDQTVWAEGVNIPVRAHFFLLRQSRLLCGRFFSCRN